MAAIKRLVTLSLADLEKYPTLTDRYAATLPFSDIDAPCECSRWHDYSDKVYYRGVCKPPKCRVPIWWPRMKAKCIKQTGERWSWFSSARKLDDERGERLGTLGYLPWEVRQEIWRALFCADTFYDDIHEFRREMILETNLDGNICPPIFPLDRSRHYGMRFASPSTKAEFEHYYLTKTVFSSWDPTVLEGFLNRLSAYQKSLVRSLVLIIFPSMISNSRASDDVNDWVDICARLPRNLVSIQFGVVDWTLRCVETGGQFFMLDNGSPRLHQTITLLEILGKRARRCANRANIGLHGCFNGPEDVAREGGELIGVFNELEPWSANWLEWWEGATKFDLDDGELASNVA